MKKIGILFHPKSGPAREKAAALETFLAGRGMTVWQCSAWKPEDARECLPGTDLVLTVGGDGTILRAFQAIGEADVPVVGVNLGKVGFMTELDADDNGPQVLELVNGGGWTDERAMLDAELVSAGGRTQHFRALNDVVVARGSIARLIIIDVELDRRPYDSFRADAVIVATATGSTGYSFAVGGPVLYPQCRDLLLTPVAAHLGAGHSVILPETAEVTLKVDTYLDATLSIDGHINQQIEDGDTVTVRRSSRTARFRRLRPREDFLTSLEEKLKGR